MKHAHELRIRQIDVQRRIGLDIKILGPSFRGHAFLNSCLGTVYDFHGGIGVLDG